MRNTAELKDKFKGQDIWVVGSGASAVWIEPDFFKNKIAIGINRIYYRFELTYLMSKHTDYIKAAIEAKQTVIMSKYKDGDIENGLNGSGAAYVFGHKGVRHGDIENNFDKNLEAVGQDDDIFVSYSTITSGIHLAAYMGAKNIIMVGHDCGYLDGCGYVDRGAMAAETYPENLLKFHGSKKACDDYYKKWFRDVEKQTIALKKKIKQVYGCDIYSLNPFINLNLEGHKFTKEPPT